MRTLLDRFYDYVISPGRKKVSPCGQIKKMKKLSFLIWWKREYYLVSIQKSSERVFISRKNMTFFLGMVGQASYEIKTEPVRKKIYDQAIWRLAELDRPPDEGK